jgi:hypothetical protein
MPAEHGEKTEELRRDHRGAASSDSPGTGERLVPPRDVLDDERPLAGGDRQDR